MAIGSFKPGSLSDLNNFSAYNKSMERLSSGRRINRASDDSAGLAIANQLDALVVTSQQGRRNVADASSMMDIADTALSSIGGIMTRMQELAAQASNGTLDDTKRAALNEEYQGLAQEAQRIQETASFNGINVFGNSEVNIQAGNSVLSTPALDISAITASAGDISTMDNAKKALDQMQQNIQDTAAMVGRIGSMESRLDTAAQRLADEVPVTQNAISRIRDADIAQESANNLSAQIRMKAGLAMGAQSSKLSGDIVLRLLT